jgi:hypothetical protein
VDKADPGDRITHVLQLSHASREASFGHEKTRAGLIWTRRHRTSYSHEFALSL